MFFDRSPIQAKSLPIALLLVISAYAGATDISTFPLSTYAVTSAADVKPNVMFVLDDSGSMAWDFMPDWAQPDRSNINDSQYRNASYNGLAYNPAIKYTPPVLASSTGDTSGSYPSMTGAGASNGADPASTLPNWNAVKSDAYGVQDTAVWSLTPSTGGAPIFYTTIAGEFCTSTSLRSCSTTSSSTTIPAYLRWCNSSALSNCKAGYDATNLYYYPRMPSPRQATITVSGSLITSLDNIKVDGLQIMSGTATALSSSSSLASSIVDRINDCTYAKVGQCNTVGYFAAISTASSNKVIITAPGITSSTPTFINKVGTMTLTADGAFSGGTVPGENIRTTITPSVTSYPYPGTSAKAGARTDCAGTTCTFQEEMTNYANWHTYYRTRMQMMKSAASNAFANIDTAADLSAGNSRFRMGFMTINNANGTDFVNLGEFTGTQKFNWYSKLVRATPNGNTPLRLALSNAGRLYGGKLGTTFNGVTVVDPVQYSCQQNYTILSTDGFWNSSAGTKLDGSTAVGNQDADQAAPYGDGGTAATQQISTSTLQKATWRRTAGTWGTYSNATGTCTKVPFSVDCKYTAWSNWSVGACVAIPQSTGPTTYTQLTAKRCQVAAAGGTTDTLADVAAYYYNTDLRTTTPITTADATGTCTGASGNDLCTDNVPSNGRDVAKTQHMTTFTLGLGAQGQMIYAPQKDNDYWKDTSGDFFDVFKRSTTNSSTGVCSWQISGLCYWPAPAADSNANIDDLWHTAINGRGTYFSAKDPASLATGLSGVLAQITSTPRPGTQAAAASSNPNVTPIDNFVFSSAYESIQWTGEVLRQRVEADGTLTEASWFAGRLLDCSTTSWAANTAYAGDAVFRNGTGCYRVKSAYTSGASFDNSSQGLDFLHIDVINADESATTPVAVVAKTSRTIYTNSTSSLIPFTLADLTTAGLNASFSETYLTSRLSQFCSSGTSCLSSANKTSASGSNLINYLRGDRTYESSYYRARAHVLGDIVSSEAKYVKTPYIHYTDAGFAAYRTAQLSRNGAVYVGANDGMLHAFDATSGQELWAYIPAQLLPNLYQLADNNYATQHQFFVDGSPEIGEVYGPCRPATTLHPTPCTGSEWRTVLVGGLNRGGKGYYALDITDPADPIFLWQFTDSNMGYTYGNPKITKLKTGDWVVLLSSGYNNADSKGYLYVVNALAGTSVRTIATGSIGELTRINSRALSPDTNNTSIAAYGGDTAGNLWRFDINGDIGATGYDAQLLVNLQDATGKAQPLTAQPEVATVNGQTMVYVGSGKYLGVSDISNTDQQSFYGVVDRSDAVTLPTPRSTGSKFVKQILTDGTCPSGAPTSLCAPGQTVRGGTSYTVDWTTNNGWYIDFLGSGERAATDPALALGSVLFTTIVPAIASANPCGEASTSGGKSFLYSLDYKTGGAVLGSTSGLAGVSLGDILATRPVPVELPSGKIVVGVTGTVPGNVVPSVTIFEPPINYNNGAGLRRISWRELTSQ